MDKICTQFDRSLVWLWPFTSSLNSKSTLIPYIKCWINPNYYSYSGFRASCLNTKCYSNLLQQCNLSYRLSNSFISCLNASILWTRLHGLITSHFLSIKTYDTGTFAWFSCAKLYCMFLILEGFYLHISNACI